MSSYDVLIAMMAGAGDRRYFACGVAAMSDDDWPEFPCEDPTATELDDWLRVWNSSIKGLDVEALLRGATPPSLISVSRAADLTDFLVLTPAAEPDAAKRMRHNAAVKKAHREEAIRVESYEAGVLRVRNSFAGQLEKALRRTAPARLRRLKVACAIPLAPGTYDGVAMMTALRALVGLRGPTQRQSSAWHERQWERMRDTVPPELSDRTRPQRGDKLSVPRERGPYRRPHSGSGPATLCAGMAACGKGGNLKRRLEGINVASISCSCKATTTCS